MMVWGILQGDAAVLLESVALWKRVKRAPHNGADSGGGHLAVRTHCGTVAQMMEGVRGLDVIAVRGARGLTLPRRTRIPFDVVG